MADMVIHTHKNKFKLQIHLSSLHDEKANFGCLKLVDLGRKYLV